MQVVSYFVVAPSGSITVEQQAALAAGLGVHPSDIPVERGYQSPLRAWLFVAFLSVALLTLLATSTTTALSMGEARRDLATLAAVGAPAGVRRRLAAAQAGMLALIGTVLGLVVGSVPGALWAWAVTHRPAYSSSQVGPGFVVVPWLLFAAALVLVPLLAAALSALFVKGRPDLTRRLA
ncbi:putative ABC transport system permease protein [Kineosphaera limosa]|uniref:FtsX-like permease family protein n=1 Tax=Kineosphaera limosa TaxID=111564 RepID=UPI0012FC52DE|nr:FtsX-like permease family protein [Kineosphaera limosa]NYE00381.1 putative ABC transport system permease protein [Kineosphaera limosa]